jgi:hypothetical protein
MKLKTLSLYRDFVDFLRKDAHAAPKHAKIGDLLLTFKLINTSDLSSESKITYAYLFFHRDDVAGFKVPVLSERLGMASALIRINLKELVNTKHIALITALRADDLSQLAYYYKIVDLTKYGMLDLEKGQCTPYEE